MRGKIACSYFFAAPSLVYGLFTSLLPALKQQIDATTADVGAILFCLGCATLAGLFLCGLLLTRVTPRLVMGVSVIWIITGIILASLAHSVVAMGGWCIVAGLGVGFCDVAMNAQGIFIEKKYGLPCLSFLHAISSLGGVAGALAGAFSASQNWSPFTAFCLAFGIMMIFWLPAFSGTAAFMPDKTSGHTSFLKLNVIVWSCAILSLLCHIAEGSAGEWGSILLQSIKGAPQQEAALAFAAFTAAMVASRLAGDWLRVKLGDFIMVLAGCLLGALGMGIVLIAGNVWNCLGGYLLMGFGLGPVVPIFFSRAGGAPHTTPGQASAAVSLFSYAGMLVVPPCLGMLANSWGLLQTLWVIPVICIVTGLGAFVIRSPKRS